MGSSSDVAGRQGTRGIRMSSPAMRFFFVRALLIVCAAFAGFFGTMVGRIGTSPISGSSIVSCCSPAAAAECSPCCCSATADLGGAGASGACPASFPGSSCGVFCCCFLGLVPTPWSLESPEENSMVLSAIAAALLGVDLDFPSPPPEPPSLLNT